MIAREPHSSPARASRAWPWLLLGGWLALAAVQLWSLQVEAVQWGEMCSTAPKLPLWQGGAR